MFIRYELNKGAQEDMFLATLYELLQLEKKFLNYL